MLADPAHVHYFEVFEEHGQQTEASQVETSPVDHAQLSLEHLASNNTASQVLFSQGKPQLQEKKRKIQSTESSGDEFEGVSIIVCAWNELDNLKQLIPLLLQQDHPNFEIIIVDDRSQDECYDFLLLEALKYKNLRLVRINHMPHHITPKKYALTLGIRASRYDVLLLTDADCRPTSNQWVREMQTCLKEDKELVLGYSPYRKEPGFLNFFIRYETFYTAVQYFSLALAGKPYMGVGRNLMYRKALFYRTNGFYNHQQVVGGDDDLFISEAATPQNVSVCLQPEAFTVSIPKTSFKSWYRQKKRHLAVGKHYKSKDKQRLGILSFTQIAFWICFIGLLFSQDMYILIATIAAFLLRMTVLTVIMNKAKKRLELNFGWLTIPFFDFLYVFYYIIIGLSALFSKKIQWN